jgi:hypothetical protein
MSSWFIWTELVKMLAELGCIDDGKISPAAVAQLLAEKLEDAHVADSLDQVPNVEVPVGTLAKQLLGGDEDPDLIDTIRPWLSSGPTGKVQLALSNGYMLCSGRVAIEVVIDGETRRPSCPSTARRPARPASPASSGSCGLAHHALRASRR